MLRMPRSIRSHGISKGIAHTIVPREAVRDGRHAHPRRRPLFSATGFANFDGGRAAGEIDMKCFVAMAFSHEDTNRLYEEILSRALSAQGIDCVRIDRLDYNGDIDDRMMEEIESADLMIADLTYARPSVYYEAGYAERAIPVIYTIRRDHLKPRADDEFGVLRLHFDLAMRNVIDWADPGDEVFRARLDARIESVTRPLRRDRDAEARRAKAVKSFQRKPILDRRIALEKRVSAILKEKGFKDSRKAAQKQGLRLRADGQDHYDDFFRYKAGTYHFLNIAVHPDLDENPDAPDWTYPPYNLNLGRHADKIRALHETWVIFAFHKVSFEALCNDASSFKPDEERRRLAESESLSIPKFSGGFDGSVFVHGGNVARDIVGGLWSGKEYKSGYLTGDPPPGAVSAAHVTGLRFVYSGQPKRAISRTVHISLLDRITCLEDAEERFRTLLADEIAAA